MSKLRKLIKEEIQKILEDKDYKNLNTIEQNLFTSYSLLGELLNPDHAYEYYPVMKGWWEFKDDRGYEFFVRITYQPIKKGYWEIKMGWSDLPKQERYLQQKAREVDEKRSDTIAKIYRDEIIPFFESQDFNNNLVISPLDIKRYQFSIRLVRKFTPPQLNIIENKPDYITITK